jgi:hypothetical protein
MIEKLAENKFFLKKGGHSMTLERVQPVGFDSPVWSMTTHNAAVRAYNRGFAVPKYFDSLQSVEKSYKSWSGIAQLASI